VNERDTGSDIPRRPEIKGLPGARRH
jgi:hypothetical protein